MSGMPKIQKRLENRTSIDSNKKSNSNMSFYQQFMYGDQCE